MNDFNEHFSQNSTQKKVITSCFLQNSIRFRINFYYINLKKIGGKAQHIF